MKIGLVLFLVLVPSPGLAQVVINEVAWMGVPVESVEERQWWRYEWLELYNAGAEPVSLNGWVLELSRDKVDLHVSLRGSIEPQGYFVVAASSKIPGADVNYASLSGKFVNSGQKVELKNAAGELVEEVDAKAGWFAGDNDMKSTMERRFPEREANNKENWGSSQALGGTPKVQNSVFDKEKVLVLQANASAGSTDLPQAKKAFPGASFVETATNKVFILALAVALASALSILLLGRFLLREQPGEGSSGALKD